MKGQGYFENVLLVTVWRHSWRFVDVSTGSGGLVVVFIIVVVPVLDVICCTWCW